MNFKKGNLYTSEAIKEYDWVGFTANSKINKAGALIMGAGGAKACKDLYTGVELTFGKKIVDGEEFNVKTSIKHKVFALQTKVDWREKSNIALVSRSINRLKELLDAYPELTFACTFPAIQNGGLKREDILPMLKLLPNNIDIWEL